MNKVDNSTKRKETLSAKCEIDGRTRKEIFFERQNLIYILREKWGALWMNIAENQLCDYGET